MGLGLVGGVIGAGLIAPGAIAAGLLVAQVSTTADPVSVQLAGKSLSATPTPLVTTVLDRTGQPIAQLFDQYRLPVSYPQIAPAMAAAIVAVEDRRFFQNAGVDPGAVVRRCCTTGPAAACRAPRRSLSST